MLLTDYIPKQYREGAFAVSGLLPKLDEIVISAHVNLDGDALGALSACGYILEKLKRKYFIYSSTPVPHYLEFLKLPKKIYSHLYEAPFNPKAAIYLDCSEYSRLGPELANLSIPSINIDHHLTDHGLGTMYNYIDPQASAACQLMAYVGLACDISLNDYLAVSLALGLITDTGGFSHSNTNAQVFSLCALLAENGCDFSLLRDHLQSCLTLNRLHLWGKLFSEIEIELGGIAAFSKISLEDFSHFHCSAEDIEGLGDKLRQIKGVQISAVIRQESATRCKFSLRSAKNIDVQFIAAKFGGGGHKNAAGGLIDASLDESRNILLTAMRDYLSLR